MRAEATIKHIAPTCRLFSDIFRAMCAIFHCRQPPLQGIALCHRAVEVSEYVHYIGHARDCVCGLERQLCGSVAV